MFRNLVQGRAGGVPRSQLCLPGDHHVTARRHTARLGRHWWVTTTAFKTLVQRGPITRPGIRLRLLGRARGIPGRHLRLPADHHVTACPHITWHGHHLLQAFRSLALRVRRPLHGYRLRLPGGPRCQLMSTPSLSYSPRR